jgi:hypothetical protein
MAEDRIETLVGDAHILFEKISIFDVFDLADRNGVAGIITDYYGPVEDEKDDKYLKILEQLRGILDP